MVFKEKMAVMQVRPNYSILYQFKPYLKIQPDFVKTRRDFTKFIKDISTNWKDGNYFIRCSEGTFAYFNLEGKKVKLIKKNKSGNDYICWQYFTTPTRIVKKATTKRKITKKK